MSGAGSFNFNSTAKELFGFRAGVMEAKEKEGHLHRGKYTVTANEAKGKLLLLKEDGMVHLQWKNISNNSSIDKDIIIMPNDSKVTRVNTGIDKDRVYLWQFTDASSARTSSSPSENNRLFFYMQYGHDNDRDKENIRKLNAFLTNPDGDGSDPVNNQAPLVPNLESLAINNSTGGQNTSTTGGLTSEDLQRAMMGLLSDGALSGGAPSSDRMQVPLQEVVTPEVVSSSGILDDPVIVNELIPLLAEGQQSVENIEATLHSPQLRSAFASLTAALQSDNFNSVLANFGLDPAHGAEHLARGDTIGAFLASLYALEQQRSSTTDNGDENTSNLGPDSPDEH